jgi:hypothetical protein
MSQSLPSLCNACFFVRYVRGRKGQQYLMCQNPEIPAKYLPQPVLTCDGYKPAAKEEPPAD